MCQTAFSTAARSAPLTQDSRGGGQAACIARVMDIGKSLQPPDWIDSGAVITGGLDLLGLRLPVQFIGGMLLDEVHR